MPDTETSRVKTTKLTARITFPLVVYFDQLSGAARTRKLAETFFQPFYNLFCSFQRFFKMKQKFMKFHSKKVKINEKRLKSVEIYIFRYKKVRNTTNLCQFWVNGILDQHLEWAAPNAGQNIQQIGVKQLLCTWGTSEQKWHLTISDGLLGQIVVDDESVHAVVAEELAHGAARVGGQVLEGGSVRSGSRNDNAKREIKN